MSSQENREDFENLFEHFPDEIRENLNYMRERGMSVEMSMRALDKEIRAFFQQCEQGKLQGEEMNAQHQTIRNKYSELLQDSDIRIVIATNMENKVQLYLKALDDKIAKAKCELEAQEPGITCKLEKKINEELVGGSKINKSPPKSTNNKKELNHKKNSKKGRNGPGAKAMAATANQAIIDSDVADGGLCEYFINLGREKPANLATQNPLQATGGNKKKKNPTCIVTSELASSSVSGLAPSAPALSLFSPSWNAADMLPSVGIPSTGLCDLPGSDAVIGVSEPHTGTPSSDALSDQQRYCLCNGVSHGPMIACDHEGCPQQWFHFRCVNVTRAPKGKWHCPTCKLTILRQRSKRKN